METPNWLKNKCSKVINVDKRSCWDNKGCAPDNYFGCLFCEARVQKKCRSFNWDEWICPEDLAFEKTFKEGKWIKIGRSWVFKEEIK